MSKHANTVDTLPKHRYLNGLQNYHFDSPTGVTVECESDTVWLNRVVDIGISAGLVQVDGTPVSVDGTLSVPRVTHVVHDPTRGDRGSIDLQTDY